MDTDTLPIATPAEGIVTMVGVAGLARLSATAATTAKHASSKATPATAANTAMVASSRAPRPLVHCAWLPVVSGEPSLALALRPRVTYVAAKPSQQKA